MTLFFNHKRVAVLGGCGLIGRQLVDLLVDSGARVRVVDRIEPRLAQHYVDYRQYDLRYFDDACAACDDQEIVFNLIGVKGSPKMAKERPASFLVPILMAGTNAMEAARLQGVKQFLYTSSIGVYNMAGSEPLDEGARCVSADSADLFPGLAKRMGELQARAYDIEYSWNGVSVVRPSNIYGPWDNFDPASAMVIPALIARCAAGENPLKVWGDGTPRRDVLHAYDAARAMMLVVEKGDPGPINIGSGVSVSIAEIARLIAGHFKVEVDFDYGQPSGDPVRVLKIDRLKALGFKPHYSLEQGISETIEWYVAHADKAAGQRYNPFVEVQ
jgi:GDP-L-fucose synthase